MGGSVLRAVQQPPPRQDQTVASSLHALRPKGASRDVCGLEEAQLATVGQTSASSRASRSGSEALNE